MNKHRAIPATARWLKVATDAKRVRVVTDAKGIKFASDAKQMKVTSDAKGMKLATETKRACVTSKSESTRFPAAESASIKSAVLSLLAFSNSPPGSSPRMGARRLHGVSSVTGF